MRGGQGGASAPGEMSSSAPIGSLTTPARPLQGLVVADFSRVLAGPLATMILGDLGAQVIKIEHPDGGDETRTWGPPFTKEGESAYYLALNRNKRSIALDLGNPSDCAIAREIALRADLLVENFRQGTMKRFGLSFDSLRKENPGLIYCRISGIGPGSLPGYDFLAQAVGGLMSITGPADGPPMKVGVAIVDVITAFNATTGILAALHARARTGRGQRVDVDLLGSALFALVNQASSYLVSGKVPGRLGNQHPNIAPYETLATSTEPLVIAVGNDKQFKVLCRILGLDWIAEDPRWTTNAARVRNRNALVALLESALVSRPCGDWVHLLSENGIPCGAVNAIDQAFHFAQGLGMEVVRYLERPDGQSIPTVSNPLHLSETPVSYVLPPPRLDEQGAEIRAWLGGVRALADQESLA